MNPLDCDRDGTECLLYDTVGSVSYGSLSLGFHEGPQGTPPLHTSVLIYLVRDMPVLLPADVTSNQAMPPACKLILEALSHVVVRMPGM